MPHTRDHVTIVAVAMATNTTTIHMRIVSLVKHTHHQQEADQCLRV